MENVMRNRVGYCSGIKNVYVFNYYSSLHYINEAPGTPQANWVEKSIMSFLSLIKFEYEFPPLGFMERVSAQY
jgi:hypothetical protein